MRKMKKTEEEK